MKKWETLNQFKIPVSQRGKQNSKFKIEELITVLLNNRGFTEEKDIKDFLDPQLEKVTSDSVGINGKSLRNALKRIQKAIEKKEQIVIFGDYDVDGICASAILWETLHKIGARVTPYIPHRIDEGYGLSIQGIENLKSQISDINLIITVDNGIVAYEAVEFANQNKIDVIITDHHVPSSEKESRNLNAYEVVHTTQLCGTGVAWILSEELKKLYPDIFKNDIEKHLELVALATIADLVPLTKANRIVVFYGLQKLHTTKRVGLLELFNEAGIEQESIDTFTIGHVIAPRLNAMGRMEFAMESLRLLCTPNKDRAGLLAEKLGQTNKERQQITQSTALHARLSVLSRTDNKKLLFLHDESYQQGVIGLVAGRLVEEFYRPAIVISKGEKYSKASARSVSGFNIIEFIRSASEFLVNAGGHPMAAGFTVETEKIHLLQEALENMAEKLLHEDLLIKTLKVDCELDLSVISEDLYLAIQRLAPFGMANPEPVFVSRNVILDDMKLVGKEGKHLKIKVMDQQLGTKLDGIAFGMGDISKEFKVGDTIDIAYSISLNVWNGRKSMQVKIKDIHNSSNG